MKRLLGLLFLLFSLAAVAQTRPENLVIQGNPWTVKWVKETPSCPNDSRKGECAGISRLEEKTIYLVPQNDESENIAYLIHEIIHAALWEKFRWDGKVQDFAFKQSTHDSIYRFAPLLADVLQSSPALVKYIQENEKKIPATWF